MATATVEIWRDTGFTEGSVEVPSKTSSLPSPTYTFYNVNAPRDSLFSTLKLAHAFEDLYDCSYLRITLDMNISSSNRTECFLDPVIARRPVMEAGSHILEVKYDEFLPDYIKISLELGTLRQTSFSKFYLCRYYHL